MSGKQRTVYFFEPVVIGKNGVAKQIADGFWQQLHGYLDTLAEDDRRIIFRGRKIEGEANATKAPVADFIYIAKLRPGSDWPDIRAVDGTHGTLAGIGAVGALLEPAYLVGVSGTKYCAILRSSAGPTFTAIEMWLNLVCGYAEHDNSLELRPFVRSDQVQRLAAAQGASKIRLKVEPDALDDQDYGSDIARGMAMAQAAAGSGVSIDMTISFGNAQPDGPGSEQLVRGVRDILRTPGVKHASATLLVPGDDGLEKDKIDFVRDRVTFQQDVGESEDEQPTPEVVMAAMAVAIAEFKKQL